MKKLPSLIIQFFIYSFCGWLYETVCESIFAGRFVLNKGFLTFLPICPIYGFGAFIVLFLAKKLGITEKIKIFIFGTLVTTAVEYFSALLLEGILHKSLWDYSKWVFNFQGRVSLISSLIFGFGSVCAFAAGPKINKKCIGKRKYDIIGIVIAIAIAADLIYTVMKG